MARSHLIANLHDHEILVNLGGCSAEERCELILVGGDLAVTGLQRNSHHEALMLDLLHACHGNWVNCRHVVVGHLLTAWGVLAHDGAARELQVGATVVVLARNEEEFLQPGNDANDEGRLSTGARPTRLA
eukprot:scaffold59563_cov30-Tisochrysis_lutea.AAC.2